MKKLLYLIPVIAILFSCQPKEKESEETQSTEKETETIATNKFGEKVDEASAISMVDLSEMMNTQELAENIVVKGKVTSVCKKKGCWMTLEKEDGETMRVTFKDYALFMPFDIPGKEVVIRGKAEKKVTPVDELKHYAEDEGQSEEVIAAITEDKVDIAFEADGVLIK